MNFCKQITKLLYVKFIFFIKKFLYFKKQFVTNEEEINNITDQIKKNGFFVFDNFFDKNICEKIINQIDTFKENNKNLIWQDENDCEFRIFGSEKIDEEIKNFFSNKKLINVGSKCLGRRVLNLMTMANMIKGEKKNLGSGGGWHRDDINFQFKAIVYLCDVNDENGPFQIVKNSNKFFNIIKDSMKLKVSVLHSRIEDKSISLLDQKRIETIKGKAGTLILVDTSLIHRGKPLVNGCRYALTNYYYPYYQINSMKNRFLPKI